MSVTLKFLSRYVFLNSTLKHLTFFRFLVNPTCFYCLEELNGGETVKKRNSKQLITEVSSFSYPCPKWVGVHVPERMTKMSQNDCHGIVVAGDDFLYDLSC